MRVERVDFISIVSQDLDRSKRFYTHTLELPLENERPTGFEVRAGQVTLSVWDPSSADLPFAPNPNDVALRVEDVAESRQGLEAKGVGFRGEILDTGVCHMAFFHRPGRERAHAPSAVRAT